jgi:hypothetical protein
MWQLVPLADRIDVFLEGFFFRSMARRLKRDWS